MYFTSNLTHFSGSSALSPDSRTLLTYNLRDGMDLYQVGHDIAQRSYRYPPQIDSNYPMPVCFLNDGRIVTCGSATGNIRLWDTSTGVTRQTLEHDGISLILTLCYPELTTSSGHIIQSISVSQPIVFLLITMASILVSLVLSIRRVCLTRYGHSRHCGGYVH